MKSPQSEEMNKLLYTDIPELVDKQDVYKDIEISSKFLKSSYNVVERENSRYNVIQVALSVRDVVSGEEITQPIILLNVPVYENGYLIKGLHLQRLGRYDKADGWLVTQKNGAQIASLHSRDRKSVV